MKAFMFIVMVCTVALAIKPTEAKKGCLSFGMACLGGHGKRSVPLSSQLDSIGDMVPEVPLASEQDALHPGAILQVVTSNELNNLADGNSVDFEPYPKYRLLRILKTWFNGNPARRAMEHYNELDYPVLPNDINNINNKNNNNNAFKYAN